MKGWQYRTPRCARCGNVGAMYSVYSQRNVCPACLRFERTVAEAQAAREQAEMDAAQEMARDEADTLAGLRQF